MLGRQPCSLSYDAIFDKLIKPVPSNGIKISQNATMLQHTAMSKINNRCKSYDKRGNNSL